MAWNELKTSVRIVGTEWVDEFEGLCGALGLRPHALVKLLVEEGIARHRRENPDVDRVVELVSAGRRERRAELGIIDQGEDGPAPAIGARRAHLQALR